MSEIEIQKFQIWVREQGDRFISDADEYISRVENVNESSNAQLPTVAGVGIYFFRGRE
jgi:hypothetical protein